MSKRYLVVAVLAVALTLCLGAGQAFADCCCGMKGARDGNDKVHAKAMMMLSHEDELGLSEDQVKKIKDLKHKSMKEKIMADAEIDVVMVDIKSAMWEDPINTEAVDKLIDKKYDLKKAEAKAMVAGCAELQKVLTKEQKDKLKAIMKEEKKSMMKSGMCKMMKGMHGK